MDKGPLYCHRKVTLTSEAFTQIRQSGFRGPMLYAGDSYFGETKKW